VLGITVLGSGSGGNALIIRDGNTALLLDAGFSFRELERRSVTADVPLDLVSAILVSHEHNDHIKGLGPTARRLEAPVYCNRMTAEAIRSLQQRPPGSMNLFASGSEFSIGPFGIEPFSIPHDATDPAAFIIHWGNRKIAVATDLGYAGNLVTHRLRDCDVLIIESNHDVPMLLASKRPWPLKQRIMSRHGHLSNEACMDLVRNVVSDRTRHVVFAHASRECNTYQMVEEHARKCLAEIGRPDIDPMVARQDEPLPTIWMTE